MNIKDKLKELATTNGWEWEYGRSDYNNLTQAKTFESDSIEGYNADETILICDPIRTSQDNDNQITSNGSFMILTRSNHDMTYQERYDLFIAPLLVVIKSMRTKLKCEWDINSWSTTEVINVFDINADGILVTFTTKGYE